MRSLAIQHLMSALYQEPAATSALRADAQAAAWSLGISRGDHAALAAFYEAWFDRCVILAGSLTGRDQFFCLDVVQNAMLRMTRAMRPLRTHADLSRWVMRVVHTAALDELKAERRRAAREAAAAQSEVGSMRDLDSRIDWIGAQMGLLRDGPNPHPHAELLVLRFVQGLSLEQTGLASGITPGAAHGKLRRALAAIESLWKNEGEQ